MELYFKDMLYIKEKLNNPEDNLKLIANKIAKKYNIEKLQELLKQNNNITELILNNDTVNSSINNTNDEQYQQQQTQNNTELDTLTAKIKDNLKKFN